MRRRVIPAVLPPDLFRCVGSMTCLESKMFWAFASGRLSKTCHYLTKMVSSSRMAAAPSSDSLDASSLVWRSAPRGLGGGVDLTRGRRGSAGAIVAGRRLDAAREASRTPVP
eukprot:858071-Pyramimonas_sp.AAC.1